MDLQTEILLNMYRHSLNRYRGREGIQEITLEGKIALKVLCELGLARQYGPKHDPRTMITQSGIEWAKRLLDSKRVKKQSRDYRWVKEKIAGSRFPSESANRFRII